MNDITETINNLELSESKEANIVNDHITSNAKPCILINEAAEIASVLGNLITKRNLYTVIRNQKYVHVEGWGLMMAMLKVYPTILKCVRLNRDDKDEIIYEVEAALINQNGKEICRALSICSNKEDRRGNQAEYVIMSMAETRAVGKVCRLAFGWIMKLAGYEATPAEEMKNIYSKNKDYENDFNSKLTNESVNIDQDIDM